MDRPTFFSLRTALRALVALLVWLFAAAAPARAQLPVEASPVAEALSTYELAWRPAEILAARSELAAESSASRSAAERLALMLDARDFRAVAVLLKGRRDGAWLHGWLMERYGQAEGALTAEERLELLLAAPAALPTDAFAKAAKALAAAWAQESAPEPSAAASLAAWQAAVLGLGGSSAPDREAALGRVRSEQLEAQRARDPVAELGPLWALVAMADAQAVRDQGTLTRAAIVAEAVLKAGRAGAQQTAARLLIGVWPDLDEKTRSIRRGALAQLDARVKRELLLAALEPLAQVERPGPSQVAAMIGTLLDMSVGVGAMGSGRDALLVGEAMEEALGRWSEGLAVVSHQAPSKSLESEALGIPAGSPFAPETLAAFFTAQRPAGGQVAERRVRGLVWSLGAIAYDQGLAWRGPVGSFSLGARFPGANLPGVAPVGGFRPSRGAMAQLLPRLVTVLSDAKAPRLGTAALEGWLGLHADRYLARPQPAGRELTRRLRANFVQTLDALRSSDRQRLPSGRDAGLILAVLGEGGILSASTLERALGQSLAELSPQDALGWSSALLASAKAEGAEAVLLESAWRPLLERAASDAALRPISTLEQFWHSARAVDAGAEALAEQIAPLDPDHEAYEVLQEQAEAVFKAWSQHVVWERFPDLMAAFAWMEMRGLAGQAPSEQLANKLSRAVERGLLEGQGRPAFADHDLLGDGELIGGGQSLAALWHRRLAPLPAVVRQAALQRLVTLVRTSPTAALWTVISPTSALAEEDERTQQILRGFQLVAEIRSLRTTETGRDTLGVSLRLEVEESYEKHFARLFGPAADGDADAMLWQALAEQWALALAPSYEVEELSLVPQPGVTVDARKGGTVLYQLGAAVLQERAADAPPPAPMPVPIVLQLDGVGQLLTLHPQVRYDAITADREALQRLARLRITADMTGIARFDEFSLIVEAEASEPLPDIATLYPAYREIPGGNYFKGEEFPEELHAREGRILYSRKTRSDFTRVFDGYEVREFVFPQGGMEADTLQYVHIADEGAAPRALDDPEEVLPLGVSGIPTPYQRLIMMGGAFLTMLFVMVTVLMLSNRARAREGKKRGAAEAA